MYGFGNDALDALQRQLDQMSKAAEVKAKQDLYKK